jgi:hypothetical protein
MAARYVVREINGRRRGEKRWVPYDTKLKMSVDDAHVRKSDASEVCRELNNKEQTEGL